ncbi:MAG: EAL domain-containing protein, partial [Luteimonas sp.]|nr:EAL domain-containing protein [Luteimonas sp.]
FHKAVIHDRSGSKVGLVGTMLNITERRRREAETERLANVDVLTGLPNRRRFRTCAETALSRALEANRPFGVFYLDLDRFKNVNDTEGHDVGDQLLVQVASRLGHALREHDILSRLGGDEFAVVIPDMDRTGLADIARRIRTRLEPPFHVDGCSIRVGASIGAVVCPDDGATLDELLKHADIAMYHAKHERTGFMMFEAVHSEQIRERVDLEQRLMRALDAREISLVFQPRIRVRAGQAASVEALARWHDSELGSVPPAQFIPLAEATGLIHRLGRQVLTLACRQAAAWHNAGLGVRVAINVSARELTAPDFAGDFMEMLASYHLPGAALEIELTETALMSSPVTSVRTLSRLRAAGVRIAVDDFGTGYSSLAHLKRLPVDALKVDQGFVADMITEPIDAGIVETIVALARSLGLGVIGEGVESREQEQALLALGCDRQQGIRFCRPLPAIEIEDWLRQRGQNNRT